MMSTLYGEPLLFKSNYVCNRSGSIQAPSSTTKVEDEPSIAIHVKVQSGRYVRMIALNSNSCESAERTLSSYDSPQ